MRTGGDPPGSAEIPDGARRDGSVDDLRRRRRYPAPVARFDETAVRPLAHCTVVVTRARPGRLDAALERLGAQVVFAPVIDFVDPPDGGAALERAAAGLRRGAFDWVVLTSAVGVDRLFSVLDGREDLGETRVASIGPGTSRALAGHGVAADLVPDVAVGEDLVAAFGPGGGRVLQIRPEVARDVVGSGLEAMGWTVDEVVAYTTVAVEVDEATRAAVRRADAVTFTSTSTVDHLVAAVGAHGLPPRTVSIGPITTGALEAHGITPTEQADPHTVDGLVEAVVRSMDRRRQPPRSASS